MLQPFLLPLCLLLLSEVLSNGYLYVDNQVCNDEILWLNDNVFKLYDNQILQPENTETKKTLDDDADDDFDESFDDTEE